MVTFDPTGTDCRLKLRELLRWFNLTLLIKFACRNLLGYLPTCLAVFWFNVLGSTPISVFVIRSVGPSVYQLAVLSLSKSVNVFFLSFLIVHHVKHVMYLRYWTCNVFSAGFLTQYSVYLHVCLKIIRYLQLHSSQTSLAQSSLLHLPDNAFLFYGELSF